MEKLMLVKVAIDKTAFHFDKLFDYVVPENLKNDVKIGSRVLVPFGNSNNKRQALIYEIYFIDFLEKNLKSIHSLIDMEPIFNDEMFKIVDFLKKNVFCTYYEAIKTILPSGTNVVSNFEYNLCENIESLNLEDFSSQQQNLISMLINVKTKSELNSLIQKNITPSKTKIINQLIDLDILIKTEKIKTKVSNETVKMIKINDSFDENIKLTKKQKNVLDFLKDNKEYEVKQCCYLCGVTDAVVKALEKKKIVNIYNKEIFRIPKYLSDDKINLEDVILSEKQNQIFEEILTLISENSPKVGLLYGITGSGKTQIFIKLIEKVVSQNKQVIMLVPEISLTPQLLFKFKGLFGDDVAVIHSNLSNGERLDEYKRIKSGLAKIVVGTRSAIFAPCNNIGLIIMDEEGEASYKSDKNPRYHAREVAKLRCVYHNTLLLLASATPSIESYYNASIGKYNMFKLTERYSNAVLPEVYIVDLNEDYKTTSTPVFSSILTDEIYKNLKNGEQTILLNNRRGFHSVLTCIECGEVSSCPNCSVSLTYHKANGYLMCHYCGFTHQYDKTCLSCKSNHVRLNGLGTQKIEDELNRLFGEARILRMDADTTYSKYSYEKNFNEFLERKYDIMVGTQMIAKGLNFPNVTLVGVLSIDGCLYSEDFRNCEKAFSLITQVVGRSGRGDKKGRAYIQTYTPENPVILFAANQNFEGFYQDEIQVRKALVYPPFCDICVIGFSGDNEENVKISSNLFLSLIKEKSLNSNGKIPIKALGPTPASILKVNNKFRYRIILKCKANKHFKNMIKECLLDIYNQKHTKNINIFADINGDINI